VTTTTISKRQYEYTRKRVKDAGLEGRIQTLLKITGAGRNLRQTGFHRNDRSGRISLLRRLFRKMFQAIKAAWKDALQAIVFPEQQYGRYRRSVDFIRHYVFPGGCLPSIGAICRSIGNATDFRISHLEDITPHYAETLAHWRRTFREKIEQVRAAGIFRGIIRMWEFYFCYCEGGFRERAIGDVQMLLDNRNPD